MIEIVAIAALSIVAIVAIVYGRPFVARIRRNGADLRVGGDEDPQD